MSQGFFLYYRNHSVTGRTEHPKQVTHFKPRDKQLIYIYLKLDKQVN